jgi:heme A synthase
MILLAQVLVGLFMLWTGLSLLQVVAHTVLAALLLLSLLTLFHRLLRSDVDR